MNATTTLTMILSSLLIGIATGQAAEEFRDDFRGRLGDGWSWIREDPSGWRVTGQGLEIHVQPGNMWGPANNARNVLVRPVTTSSNAATEVSVTLENRPSGQYEQTDLVWYYDDGHMVKLGQELVDGKLSLVMGREENDHARTIAIIPIHSAVIHARLTVTNNLIRGEFREGDEKDWRRAGECDLPAKGAPQISLQAYQGLKDGEHWARFREFRIRQSKPQNASSDP